MASLEGSESLTVRVTSAPGCNFPELSEGPETVDVLISVVPPTMGTRPPTDVCCVVDVSGSMGIECHNGDAESQGLSVLDIVKHACKTVAHSLTAQDRFALVAYNHVATVTIALDYMTTEGLARTESAIDGLRAGGQTNIWDGLHSGLKLLNSGDMERMKSVVLLTDGQPNISPPRGHLPMLQQYKEETGLECTVSTFGFGYNLDSTLLKELATEGQGMYAFIPDGSLVGTVFVNATSNILSTAARNTVVKVSGLSDGALAAASVPGYSSTKVSWGLQIDIGPVMFGQTRDVVVTVPKELLADAAMVRADVDYLESGSTSRTGCGAEGPVSRHDPAAAFHALRAKVCELLTAVHAKWNAGDSAGATALRSAVVEAAKAQATASLAASDPTLKTMLDDLVKDLEGQVTEATSRQDWWTRWGKHYLPSLVSAHALQQCNNFKDPGVQHYGGPLFLALRDTAEKTFVKLPPPTPTAGGSYGGYAGGGYASNSMGYGYSSAPAAAVAVPVARPAVDMSAYYNAGGGCFVGSALVATEAGTLASVASVRQGDRLVAFRLVQGRLEVGAASVALVCETELAAAPLLVTLGKGLKLTAWHPVVTAQGQWAFPAHLAAADGALVDGASGFTGVTATHEAVRSVFNLALESDPTSGQPWHGCFLNGVPTITLGHGIENDGVAAHAYYGTSAVLRDLARLDDGSGYIKVSAADAAAALAAATAVPEPTVSPAAPVAVSV